MLKIVSLLFFLSLSLHSSYSARYDINQAFLQNYHCQPWMSECFYTLRVHSCYTMNDQRHIIYSINRTLYGYNDYEDIKLDQNSVPTGDGSYNQKLICINGTFPGPLILAYENQYVNIRVMNELDTESFTLHWHGQYQKGIFEVLIYFKNMKIFKRPYNAFHKKDPGLKKNICNIKKYKIFLLITNIF